MGLYALSCAGCLQLIASPDADPLGPDAAVDAAPLRDDASTPCSNDGEGRLRVSVSLAPSLAARSSDVWLAVHCDDGATPVRLVRWDGSPTQTLDGFGPGAWRVFGSTFLSPGAWSTMATLDGVATAAVSLTLDAEGAVLAQAGSSVANGGVDAGVADAAAADASAPPADAATGGSDARIPADAAVTPPAWSARVALRELAGGPSLGSASLTAYALDSHTLEVRVTVQSLCAQPPCADLTLHSVEARTADGATPIGFARTVFETATLAYGASTVTMPHLVLRGTLPDAQRSLQVAVYSAAPARAMAAARRP